MASAGDDGGSDFLYGNDGSTLTITGTRQQQNQSQASRPGRPGTPENPDEGSTAPPQAGRHTCVPNPQVVQCAGPLPPLERPGTTAPPQQPTAVSIDDVAQFAPAPVTATAEPGNIGIVGMPANFVSDAAVHVQTGTLFGAPVTVRFTPVAYVYSYGDGSSATLTTGGQTWHALGQAQFTPTPTSHVYRQRGTYVAEVDVRYTAEVDFGAGWIPVAGELTIDGIDQQIRILEARTALVARTCNENPDAAGC